MVPESVIPPMEFNLKELVSYVGQNYNLVRSHLNSKYAILDSTNSGNRIFTLRVTDRPDLNLMGTFEEHNGTIRAFTLEYWGGNYPIGYPYENELWHIYMLKADATYGEADFRVYINNNGSFPQKTNKELIDTIKENGDKNASYLAKWYVENKTRELSVFHSNTGRFLLRIELQ